MFNMQALQKHSAAAICALLFSSTCLLSAIGPVKAETRISPVDTVELARSTVVMPLA